MMQPQNTLDTGPKSFDTILRSEPTKQEEQIALLQNDLARERDGRKEDRFVFIVVLVLLLDVVFFSVMPTFGGPLALLVLELLVLIPLAKRMGMEEIAETLSNVIGHVAGKANH